MSTGHTDAGVRFRSNRNKVPGGNTLNRKPFTLRSAAVTAAVAGLMAAGTHAVAGDQDTATSDVSLEIMQAISVDVDQHMDFGTAYTGGSVEPADASFNVTGDDGAEYTIDAPASTDITDGTNTLGVDLTPSAASSTLVDGNDAFTVTGEITETLPGESGSYSGDFTVTVSYAD